ncbi:heparinase II/III-family protein [Myxococcota bacterium]|nr:heparinase II/III-family protein [Myxococcota bacterium]
MSGPPGGGGWLWRRLRAGGPGEARGRVRGALGLLPLAMETRSARGREAWLASLAVPGDALPALAAEAARNLPPPPPGSGAPSLPPPDPPRGSFGPWLRKAPRADRGLRRRWERDRLAAVGILPPEEARRALLRWLEVNPPPRGEAWMDGLEVAVRLVHGLRAFGRAGALGEVAASDPGWGRILACLRGSAELLRRRPAPAPPAMNHRLGEAAALWVFGAALPSLPESARLAREAGADLARQVARQLDPEGGYTREQSTGYQRWDMEWLDWVVRTARAAGRPPPEGVPDALARGLETLGLLCDPRGLPIPLGDDDGSPLLGELEVAPRWRRGRVPGAEVLWVGDEGGDVRAALVASPLGAEGIAAHGHADALAVLLWAWGEEVLVDPGTGTYRPRDPLRGYFRSTAAHSTVRVDGREAAEPGGAFLWSTRYVPEVLESGPARAAARHDGYARLADPVRLERRVAWGHAEATLTVSDRLEARGRHRVEVAWHLPEGAAVAASARTAEARCGPVRAHFSVEGGPSLSFRVAEGEEDPPLGWRSTAYERVVPSPVLLLHGETAGTAEWAVRIRLERKG